MDLLKYDAQGTIIEGTGLSPGDLTELAPEMEKARTRVLADLKLWHSGGPVDKADQPLDAGFTDLPERLLAEFQQQGEASQIGRIRTTAARLAREVDRVVLLGIGGSYMGARALMEACSHPFHNELSREYRHRWPRLYFEGNNVDNDAVQGLLDLLGRGEVANTVDNRWGIVVISKSGGTLETASAFRQLLAYLRKSCDNQKQRVAKLIVPVTGSSGKLFDLAEELGCPDVFPVPDGVGGRFSVLSAVGLLPAAILGLDIVKLLEGAAAMNEHFRTAPIGENVVLDYTAVAHAMEKKRKANIRVLSTWGKGLEATGLWYDQLLSESLGKDERGATPITGVNTRDLHSRGQQHQAGRRDKLITNLIVDCPNREPLTIGNSELNQDGLNDLAEKTLPEVMTAAIAGTNEAYSEDGRPTADLHLPRLDETCLGQLFQMLMLATVVEGRLIKINPYGQPGVEGYKRHMDDNLRGK